ncbi:MAG: hypothetical protein ACFCBW_05585 [Candidatus Competibacterales bacterium]
MEPQSFTRFALDEEKIYLGSLPPALANPDFEKLWQLHPKEYHTVVIHGREVNPPRWQQAFGRNDLVYRFAQQRLASAR